MIVYEKNNKLNINFDNELDNPDIEIGKDEVKIGEATISENNVLPVPEEGDTGKVPTVQQDGSYALANAGGSGGTLVVHDIDNTLDKTFAEIKQAMSTSVIILVYPDDDLGEIFYLVYARKNAFGEERYVKFKSISAQPVESTFITTEDNGYPVHQ